MGWDWTWELQNMNQNANPITVCEFEIFMMKVWQYCSHVIGTGFEYFTECSLLDIFSVRAV
jgi:hypothetical protein